MTSSFEYSVISNCEKPPGPSRFPWVSVIIFATLSYSLLATGTAYAQSDCAAGSKIAAEANASSLSSLPINLFGLAETGWSFYEPLVANAIATNCVPNSPGFAHALSSWQSAHGLATSGVMTAETLSRLSQIWQSRRPFVTISHHHCPDAPAEQDLEQVATSESFGGKIIFLKPEALTAYRAMKDAARKEGLLPANSRLLAIFSGYRSPTSDAVRCATEHNCQGVVRASCSAHRTGLAVDIYLGQAPGFSPDSSAQENRLFISQTTAYRWLVKNAARFGFTNYAFEPWHWEFAKLSTPE